MRNLLLCGLVPMIFVMAAGIRPGGAAMAQTNTNANASAAEARNKAIVEASFKAWSAGTGSPFDLLTDDAAWTIVGHSVVSKSYQGRETFLREVIRPFNARMREPLKPQIRRIYADGDSVIVFFDAKGMARDGKPYVNTYAWFLEMREGRVTSVSAFFDSVVFNEFWARVSPS